MHVTSFRAPAKTFSMLGKNLASVLVLMFLVSSSAFTVGESAIAVLYDERLPAADARSAPASVLRRALPDAQFLSPAELNNRLHAAKLLVLPYGSAFPETCWSEIYGFLERGGNLLVLGGRPFTRAAYQEGEKWRLRDYSVGYSRRLGIDQYQTTAGSAGLSFETNPDIPLSIPAFAWSQAFSPIIHLSFVDVYDRQGSAGSIDAKLDTLAWGSREGRRISAPLIQIDHLRNSFDHGRWILVDAELAPEFYGASTAPTIVRLLAEQALRGAEEFTVRPTVPLYLPGEPVELEVRWNSTSSQDAALSVVIPGENQALDFKTAAIPLPLSGPLVYPPVKQKGLHIVDAQLAVEGKVRAIYHSAFWIRDDPYLHSGPKLGVNDHYFELDGRPQAVIGTTYMSSEVQRLYFDHPNVYVWDRDLRQIHDAGLNMIRTGWWTGWDKFVDENGLPYERTLRTLEAYLITARKYGLPVQFTFFAFLPEVLGGVNPYLDPAAVRKQKALVSSVAERFREVPFLAYDVINEPSFSKHLWTMRPNGDPIEAEQWNKWLTKRYPNRAALATAWNVPIDSVQGTVPLPEDMDFARRGIYTGHNSLKIYDYSLFAQQSFADWVGELSSSIRQSGSNQLVTVGQDEGGFQDRPSPAFFGPHLDFTTNHTWWQNDSLLWDSLVGKQPGKPLLIQETGLQRELNLDQTSRRTPESEAALFERKMAMSFVLGSGALEWLWNTNSYMTEGNETPIGALRADGTEKPEATVMRNFAKFGALLSPHLRSPRPSQVAIIASQCAQYSAVADLQIQAQRKSVRAIAYYARLTPYLIYENQIENMGVPKLAVLPSAQALTEQAWSALLRYVASGGNLLITGSVDRDEHWQRVDRARSLVAGARTIPITYHNASLLPHDASPMPALKRLYESPLSFDLEAQSWLESLRFPGGSFMELKHGKGTIFWAAEPVELAQGELASADLYSYVAARMGLRPQLELLQPLSPGVMVYPIVLEDSVLYVIVSDNAEDTKVDFRDGSTGVRLVLNLGAERAALALIGQKEKNLLGKYGF